VKTRASIPVGLSVAKWFDGWRVFHEASRLAAHPGEFHTRAAAKAAAVGLGPLGVDWTLPADQVRAAIDGLPDGRAQVLGLLTPPEVREQRRRIGVNSTRYLRHLKEAGHVVVRRESHGLGGTVYHLSCGCVRLYGVDLVWGTPDETLAIRCGDHADLVVAELATDLPTIRRELAAAVPA
jgi:hypothetical protein